MIIKCDDCHDEIPEDAVCGDDDAPIEHEGDFCEKCWNENHKGEY